MSLNALEGKVAVVTGAAGGIGFGMACEFARNGMRLVLADIERSALSAATNALVLGGVEVVAECVDVSDPESLEQLAEHAYDAFGQVNIVCNNAGVIENNRAVWEYPLKDWNWVLGVNLMGVVHGIRAFVPRMLDSGEPGHVVNTASFGGLISGSANPIYIASKHAVVALSENLHNDLHRREAAVNVSVLCPGWVKSQIADADRNRADPPAMSAEEARIRGRFQQGIDSGLDPDDVGAMVVAAVKENRFYIHTHPDWLPVVRERCDAILDGSSPPRSLIPNPKR